VWVSPTTISIKSSDCHCGDKQVYSYIDAETTYNKNKFSQLSIDVPLEFRWRTSTYASHKFWRIYGGLKLSYLLYDNSILMVLRGKVMLLAIPISTKYNTERTSLRDTTPLIYMRIMV
jgi:hypothetical protein